MDTNKQNQIDGIFSASEQLNNIFCSVYNIAVNANTPEGLKSDISDTVSELHNCFFRIANFIAMPQSETLSPELEEKFNNFLEVVADKSCSDIDYSKQLI